MNPWCPVNQLENLSTWLCFARSFLVYCSNCLWRNLLISCKLQIFWDYLETSWTWQDWSFCLFCMSSMEIKGQINIARVPTLIHPSKSFHRRSGCSNSEWFPRLMFKIKLFGLIFYFKFLIANENNSRYFVYYFLYHISINMTSLITDFFHLHKLYNGRLMYMF